MCTVHAKGPFMNYVFNKGVIWVQTNANPGEGVSTTSFNNQIKSELSLMNFPSVVIFKNLKYLKKSLPIFYNATLWEVSPCGLLQSAFLIRISYGVKKSQGPRPSKDTS